VLEVANILKAIHAQEDLEAAREKAAVVVENLKLMTLGKASDIVQESTEEMLAYINFPCEQWVRIRTNNPLKWILREVRRRT